MYYYIATCFLLRVLSISITGSIPTINSQYLNDGRIEIEEMNYVKIWCVFKEGIEGVSCVLVYREYSNKTLVVKEYSQKTVFPVSLTVDNASRCTFAVFGKRGSDIDMRPFMRPNRPVTEKKLSTLPIGVIGGM